MIGDIDFIFSKKDYPKALSIARQLHQMCKVNGQDDVSSKSEWLLEMYSLEIPEEWSEHQPNLNQPKRLEISL